MKKISLEKQKNKNNIFLLNLMATNDMTALLEY